MEYDKMSDYISSTTTTWTRKEDIELNIDSATQVYIVSLEKLISFQRVSLSCIFVAFTKISITKCYLMVISITL